MTSAVSWMGASGGAVASATGGSSLFPWTYAEVLDYWDARYGVAQAASAERVSTWTPSLKGADSLTQGTGANQPILLPYTGTKYVWNNAVASNNISTTTISITGNWTLSLDFAALDYTPASDIVLLDKTSGNNGFKVSLLTTGVIRVTIGDGAALTNFDSTVATGQTDNTRHTFLLTYVDNATLNFSVDGVALGAQVVVNKVLTNAAMAMVLGPWDGKLYGYSLTNGAATTYYAMASYAAIAEGAASYTDGTGKTATINSTASKPAQVVGSQQVLFDGTAGYINSAAGVNLSQPFEYLLVIRSNAWGLSKKILDSTSRAILQQNSVTPQLDIFAGTEVAANGDLALNTYGIVSPVYNGASSSLGVNLGTRTTGNAGTNGTGSVIEMANHSAAEFWNGQIKAFAIVNSALSTARRNQLIQAMAAQYGIAV